MHEKAMLLLRPLNLKEKPKKDQISASSPPPPLPNPKCKDQQSKSKVIYKTKSSVPEHKSLRAPTENPS